MNTQRSRFEQLRRALDAALDAPTPMILQAVQVACGAIALADGVVWQENHELETQCQGMARALYRRLGEATPVLVRDLALRPLRGRDGGPFVESLPYECPICRARVELTAGARASCELLGHVPTPLVASLGDEEPR